MEINRRLYFRSGPRRKAGTSVDESCGLRQIAASYFSALKNLYFFLCGYWGHCYTLTLTRVFILLVWLLASLLYIDTYTSVYTSSCVVTGVIAVH